MSKNKHLKHFIHMYKIKAANKSHVCVKNMKYQIALFQTP